MLEEKKEELQRIISNSSFVIRTAETEGRNQGVWGTTLSASTYGSFST